MSKHFLFEEKIKESWKKKKIGGDKFLSTYINKIEWDINYTFLKTEKQKKPTIFLSNWK